MITLYKLENLHNILHTNLHNRFVTILYMCPKMFYDTVVPEHEVYTLKNSALYLRGISTCMSYCCKSWQLFEPNVQNYFGLIGLK